MPCLRRLRSPVRCLHISRTDSPSLVAPGYAVLPADLRDVASVRAALDKVGVDTRCVCGRGSGGGGGGWHGSVCWVPGGRLTRRVPGLVCHSKPTLFISECVLIYLQPGDSNALIQWAAKTFPSCAFAAYEQILPDDAFGRMMQKNLAVRALRRVMSRCSWHGLTPTRPAPPPTAARPATSCCTASQRTRRSSLKSGAFSARASAPHVRGT